MPSHRHAANAIVENRESAIIRKIAFRDGLARIIMSNSAVT
jgi:hypothetical protein